MELATGVRRAPVTTGAFANAPSGHAFDIASALFAAATLIAVAGTSLLHRDAERSDGAAPSSPGEPASDTSLDQAEWMFAGYAGAPFTYASDVSIRNAGSGDDFTVKDVTWDGKPFENPIYYGARVVRWLQGGAIGTMLDFTHSKTIADRTREAAFTGTLAGKPAPERAKLGDIFRKLEASHGHNMLTLNGLLRLPGLGFRLHPYVGLGAGVALPHSEVQMAGKESRTYEYQFTGPVAQGLVGIELRMAQVSYFFEYKFTFARYEMPLSERDGSWLPLDLSRQIARWWSGEEPPAGFLTTDLASHQAIAGIGLRRPIAAP